MGSLPRRPCVADVGDRRRGLRTGALAPLRSFLALVAPVTLSLRQDQRQSEPEWSAEDVEALARDFMGWKHAGSEDGKDPSRTSYFMSTLALPTRRTCLVFAPQPSSPRTAREWNPFRSADADFQVLERAREVWRDLRGDHFSYRVGTWARAVLVVLRSTQGEAPPISATEGE